MGRNNKRKKTEFRSEVGFDPWKYITPAEEPVRKSNSTSRIPQRGDIWFAELDPHEGTSVQGGCRPVMVVSNNIGNAYAETLNVLPMTRQLKKPNLPCHAELNPEVISDKQQVMDQSMILAEQITTISKTELRNYVGRIEEGEFLDAVDHAISVQLGLIPVSDQHNDERSTGI